MAITKTKKVELVADFDSRIKDAQSMVFVQFKKLNVKETIAMRRSLRAQGVEYKIIKKTLDITTRKLDNQAECLLPFRHGQQSSRTKTDSSNTTDHLYQHHHHHRHHKGPQ